MFTATTKLRLVHAMGDQNIANELEKRLFPSGSASAMYASLNLSPLVVQELKRRINTALAGGRGDGYGSRPGDKCNQKITGQVSVLQLAAQDVAAVAAHYTGTPTGASTPVTITANTAGSAGNVTLTGDGTSTIAALISAWNTAHPSNTLALTSGVGTQVPSNGASIPLTGGANASGPSTAAAKAAMGSDHMDSDQLTSWTDALCDAAAAAEFQAAYNAMVDTTQAY